MEFLSTSSSNCRWWWSLCLWKGTCHPCSWGTVVDLSRRSTAQQESAIGASRDRLCGWLLIVHVCCNEVTGCLCDWFLLCLLQVFWEPDPVSMLTGVGYIIIDSGTKLQGVGYNVRLVRCNVWSCISTFLEGVSDHVLVQFWPCCPTYST